MNVKSPLLLGLSLAFACGSLVAAQSGSPASPSGPPKVLEIMREFVKPGMQGAPHDKTESAFVQAMREAKEPHHYTGMCSLSGKLRCLYLVGFPSFDALQKDNTAIAKNKELSAKLEAAQVADGELLDEFDQSLWTYQPDLSYHAPGPTPQARLLEVTEFHIRAGHAKDWSDLAKMYIAACEKAGTSAHWAFYHLDFGGPSGVYLLLSSDKSMADIDSGDAEGKKIRDAMGEEGMKKFTELEAATVESVNSQLFAVNPLQSYVPDEWIKSDPGFWQPAQ
jgi:hypothetical protein